MLDVRNGVNSSRDHRMIAHEPHVKAARRTLPNATTLPPVPSIALWQDIPSGDPLHSPSVVPASRYQGRITRRLSFRFDTCVATHFLSELWSLSLLVTHTHEQSQFSSSRRPIHHQPVCRKANVTKSVSTLHSLNTLQKQASLNSLPQHIGRLCSTSDQDQEENQRVEGGCNNNPEKAL